MPTELGKQVDTLACALFQIQDAFADPSEVSFADVHEEMERLEAIFNAKALIDAAFAHICERDNAGRHVGARYPDAYLKERLGLSPRETYDRLARGKDLFGEPDIPEPVEPENPEDGAEDPFGAPFETGEEARARQAEEERAREEARREVRRRQEKARERAKRINAEKQQTIRQELDKLLDTARGERARLLDAALREAEHRSLKDLRALVRSWVDAENRKYASPENPNAGMEKRSLRVGPRRADGTYDISGRATAGDAALAKVLLDKGAAPNSNMSPDVEDYRTPEQRAYDQFMKIARHFDQCDKPTGGGCASVVVSVTLDQLADADATTLFQTNSGIEVTSFDLVRLGMEGTEGFVLTVDEAKGVPLNLWRSARFASVGQRIALLAAEGVCAWAGCSAPLGECDIHHAIAWIQGGETNIGNLTALCPAHHRRNNDARDHRGNTSHREHDPTTGRAGLRRLGANRLEFNNSDAAENSAGARIRRKFNGWAFQDPGPPF